MNNLLKKYDAMTEQESTEYFAKWMGYKDAKSTWEVRTVDNGQIIKKQWNPYKSWDHFRMLEVKALEDDTIFNAMIDSFNDRGIEGYGAYQYIEADPPERLKALYLAIESLPKEQ